MDERARLKECRRIVLKVGTSTLTYGNGNLNLMRIEAIVRALSDLHNRDMEVILVTSGAVGTGANRMGLKKIPKTLPEKQALAAIGQGALLHIYEKIFAEYNKTVAQVLLTRDDLDDRGRYLNAANTLVSILKMGVIPIVNENDTVVVEEIKFGDNDTLAALVAGLVDADLMVILSDVDGLYDRDPRSCDDAELLYEIREINESMLANSVSKGNTFASGGMYTKLKAAEVCMSTGIPMVVANSAEQHVVRRLLEGELIGTLFIPAEEKLQARKKWIAFGSRPQGVVVIDDGAARALVNQGKSLLPSGVRGLEGDFGRGDIVAVTSLDGRELARGIVNYNSTEAGTIMGHKSSEIEKLLGCKDFDELIHRDNLWVKASR